MPGACLQSCQATSRHILDLCFPLLTHPQGLMAAGKDLHAWATASTGNAVTLGTWLFILVLVAVVPFWMWQVQVWER